MRYAVIEDGVVVNVVVADLAWVEASEAAGATLVPDPDRLASIGGAYVDGEFIPPPGQE